MKKSVLLPLLLAVAASAPVFAQDDGSEVILPLEAQTCNLPTAPARIPDEPTYDDLVKKISGTFNNIQMSIGDGIKSSGVDGASMHHCPNVCKDRV